MKANVLFQKYLYDLAVLANSKKELGKFVTGKDITKLESFNQIVETIKQNPYSSGDLCNFFAMKDHLVVGEVLNEENEIGFVFRDLMTGGERARFSIIVEQKLPEKAREMLVWQLKNINWLGQFVYNKTEEVVRSVFADFNIQTVSDALPNICFGLDLSEEVEFGLLSKLSQIDSVCLEK